MSGDRLLVMVDSGRELNPERRLVEVPFYLVSKTQEGGNDTLLEILRRRWMNTCQRVHLYTHGANNALQLHFLPSKAVHDLPFESMLHSMLSNIT